ncbi:MAG: cupredoxin domain-containing protein [Acidimicrobiales bacterium]
MPPTELTEPTGLTEPAELPGPSGPRRRPAHRPARVAAAVATAVAAGIVGLIALWAAMASPAAAQAAPTPITIVDFDFDARTTTIPAGTAVTFTNAGERPHTATDRGGTFDTGALNPGQSGSVAFDTPGTYFIFCRINPSKMNATVVVEPRGDAPAVRVQAVDDANLEGETLRFDPPQIQVKAGTTLVFANVGGKPHSLTTFDGTYNTGILQPGPEKGRFAGSHTTLVLDRPGTFEFFCEIHPQQMLGTLVVTGAAPATTATTAPPPASTAPPATAAPPPSTAEVAIEDFAFDTAELTVAPGATITYRNTGQAPHTATFDDVALDTGTLDSGASGALVAPQQPGSYSYFCAIHPRMRATLVVLAAGIADPAAGPVATVAPGSTGGAGSDGSGASPPTTAGGAAATTAASPASTAEVAAVVSTSTSGASNTTLLWVVLTIAVACLLAGIGLAPFLSRRRRG